MLFYTGETETRNACPKFLRDVAPGPELAFSSSDLSSLYSPKLLLLSVKLSFFSIL